MNMLEALEQIKYNCEQYNPMEHSYSEGGYWARPKSWRGIQTAYTWETGVGYSSRGWIQVPTFGGRTRNANLPVEVFEEWEVVSPSQVNSGE